MKEEPVEKNLRYKVQHIGDIFVDNLVNGCSWLKLPTRGVTLTYNIRSIERKKGKSYLKIGKKTAELRKQSPDNELFGDADLLEFFSELDKMEQSLSEYRLERDERLYRGRLYKEPA
jgi:hypothetical protein